MIFHIFAILISWKAVVDFRRIMDEYRAKGELGDAQGNYEVLDAGQQGAGDDSNPNSATLSTAYSHQSKDDIHVIDVKLE